VPEPEDLICDCSALMNGDLVHAPTCITQMRWKRDPLFGESWTDPKNPENERDG
jgi:hypothetical protein